MITRTQLSLAVALSLSVTSTWAATETTVCEVWRITDGTALVTSDGRPVLTKQCKTVQKVDAVAASTPTKTEPTANTEVTVEASAEPAPEPESTAQAAEPAEPVAVVEEPAQEPALIQYQFKSYQTTILFDTDKSNLDAEDIGSLEQLAMASGTGDIVRVRLTGHADSRGTDAYNMSLSKRRIQAVASLLADFNITVTSLFAQGETAPVLVDGKEDLDLSRRVHIEVKTRFK